MNQTYVLLGLAAGALFLMRNANAAASDGSALDSFATGGVGGGGGSGVGGGSVGDGGAAAISRAVARAANATIPAAYYYEPTKGDPSQPYAGVTGEVNGGIYSENANYTAYKEQGGVPIVGDPRVLQLARMGAAPAPEAVYTIQPYPEASTTPAPAFQNPAAWFTPYAGDA
ncbi:MAG: hypothetical protein ABIN37_06475 [Burkholderiaceae bacterium]